MTTTEITRRAQLRTQLVAFTLARLVINTGHRMIYPFLPTFARGLGVELETVALAVTARSSLGLLSPLLGSLSDRHGRKRAMITAMLLFVAGMVLVMVWPTYPALFAALLLASLSKLIYDPSMQATVGDRVRYTQRGLAIAITELSWSGAFLIGVPVVGWLIARSDSWQAPFPMLAVAGLVATVLLWRGIPADRRQSDPGTPLLQGLRRMAAHRAARAGLVMGFMISVANETVSIIYGAWLEDAFALKVAALGASAIVIGIAELAAEGTVAGFVDRIGKRRSVILGIGANAIACLALPLLAFRVESALIGLFLFYLTFEFAIVSSIPLMTELMPDARATLMAGNVTAYAGGRMLGAFIGPPLFTLGMLANSVAGALFNLVALATLLLFIQQD